MGGNDEQCQLSFITGTVIGTSDGIPSIDIHGHYPNYASHNLAIDRHVTDPIPNLLENEMIVSMEPVTVSLAVALVMMPVHVPFVEFVRLD